MNEDEIQAKTAIDQMFEGYERSPVLQVLVAAIPVASVVQAGVLSAYRLSRAYRVKSFANELISLNIDPPEERAKTREFIDAIDAATRRVLETAREEKIRLFAQLFANYISIDGPSPEHFDVYEEDLSIIDDLSVREFNLLLLLKAFEDSHPPNGNETAVARSGRFWPAFEDAASENFGLSGLALQATLQRIARTGCYLPITGAFLDYPGGRGHLSPVFQRLLDHLGSGTTPV